MNKEESIQQIETLIEAWQLDEADLNQTDINAMQALLKENKKLKKQLEVGKEQYNDLIEEKEELQEQLSSNTLQLEELKKQLEEYKEQANKELYNTCLPYTTGYNKAIKDKENQQKEFIKWLEDIINTYIYSNLDDYKNVLQKYKEIIGDDK